LNKGIIIKADRIVCDQIFKLQDIDCNLPIRTTESLSAKSFINKEKSQVKVSVSHCELCIDESMDKVFIDFEVIICKDLFIHNDNTDIPVKLSYCKPFHHLEVTEWRPDLLPKEMKERLRCQVFSITADDRFCLHPEEKTFDQELWITIIVKLVFEDQIELEPPIPSAPLTLPKPLQPVIPREAIIALELTAGKIRSQIGRQRFKQELLVEVNKVKRLLFSGNVTGALTLLTAIKEQVLVKFSTSKGHLIMAYPVLEDLGAAEKQVINLL
jgi:hypothetical protein